MNGQFTAVVENGLLRPLVPVTLAEGTQVDLVIVPRTNGPLRRNPADVLAEIAALPMEPSNREFTGRDHDEIIYRK